MNVRLYDTRQQAVVEFVPIEPGEVGMYVCGPTVQSSPHIGHLRSALAYDLWRRWFTYRGYDVTFIRNVTDIDDKVIDASEGTSEPWWARAYRIELEFTAGYSTLGILPPTYEPRATANIPQIIELIQRLIDGGHAYAAAGDVYFDTASWGPYGELTRQRLDDMVAAADADPRGKRDPRDFALWKGRKSSEPESASWASPWGPGRPGWHIECSAMSRRYLGDVFDIHGGGRDLRFPHHENELAQSTAAGDSFARYWVHNGLVNVNGQKMSKSLGNSVYASELLRDAPAVVVRYYLASAHYRSQLDYVDGALEEAQAAFDRIATFLHRAGREVQGQHVGAQVIPQAFADAMDDDLGVPQALAVLHETVRAGNIALDAGDVESAGHRYAEVVAMTNVLGVNPLAPEWRSSGAADDALGGLVEQLIADRAAARENKDFATADRIRDELASSGIVLEDGPNGTRWSVA